LSGDGARAAGGQFNLRVTVPDWPWALIQLAAAGRTGGQADRRTGRRKARAEHEGRARISTGRSDVI